MLFFKMIGLVCLSFFIAACSATPEQPVSKMPDISNVCKDPRPEMCTMIYQPVCGINKEGHFKTYSSDCNACSHVVVIGYNEGACEEDVE
jgi:hypothetical protein